MWNILLLLCRDPRWCCMRTFKWQYWKAVCSTSDVLTNRSDSYHHSALLRHFCDCNTACKLQTYLLMVTLGWGWALWRNSPVLRAFCADVYGVFIWFHIFTIVKALWRDPRPDNLHLFQSGSLELTSTVSSWHVAITDSVLHATKIHCVLLSTMIHSASVTV